MSTPEHVISGEAKHCVIQGNSLDVLRTLPSNHYDGLLTDPPYFLANASGKGFMGKEWDSLSPANVIAGLCFLSMNLALETAITAESPSSERGRRLHGTASTSAPELVITRDEAVELSRVWSPSLTIYLQKLPISARLVAPTSFLDSGVKSIARHVAAMLRDNPAWKESVIGFTSTEEPNESDAIEALSGTGSDSLSIGEMVGCADDAESHASAIKSNATTSSLGKYQKTIQKLISSPSVRAATKRFTAAPNAIATISEWWHECWANEAIRVLKPGAPVLAFSGTRTSHSLTSALEASGFEIRDTLMWLYGCLSDDTDILVDGQWVPYHKATAGRLAMCYNPESDTLAWRPIQELLTYDYDDTAYRIESDSTDQIVSRNHRCLVERDGAFVFRLAEDVAREREARVPVLEGLRDLLEALPVLHEGASGQEQDMLQGVSRSCDFGAENGQAFTVESQGGVALHRLRNGVQGLAFPREEGRCPELLEAVQWRDPRCGMGEACAQGPSGVDGCVTGVLPDQDDRTGQPRVEGWRHDIQDARKLHGRQVCALPCGVPADGAQGRLRDGASAARCAGSGSAPSTVGMRTSRGPRSDEQRTVEPGSLSEQSGAQTVRASRFARSDLARITHTHYRGVVWCVRVPTGAFVARRNGKVFITGNSGFPKSLDVSKAIDAAAGAARVVIGTNEDRLRRKPNGMKTDAPATDLARDWAGYGTALKPAHEPIILARKPLEGTIAQNVSRWGTGGLAIDASRIEYASASDKEKMAAGVEKIRAKGGVIEGSWKNSSDLSGANPASDAGRWPANVLMDEEAGAYLDSIVGDRPSTLTGKADPNTSHEHPAGPDNTRSSMFGNNKAGGRVYADGGGPSRFFYSAKVSKSEREGGCDHLPFKSAGEVTGGREEGSAAMDSPRTGAGRSSGSRNHHPTLKPIALTSYLAKLILPPKRVDTQRCLLVPFSGSGSEIIGALQAGWDDVTGIEQSEEYCAIARARIAYWENSK
jgi:DNA modification methylase